MNSDCEPSQKVSSQLSFFGFACLTNATHQVQRNLKEVKETGFQAGLLDRIWDSCSGLGQAHLNGPVDANIHTGEADDALLRVVGNLPALSIHIQSACGTDRNAGRAACAALLDSLDLPGERSTPTPNLSK